MFFHNNFRPQERTEPDEEIKSLPISWLPASSLCAPSCEWPFWRVLSWPQFSLPAIFEPQSWPQALQYVLPVLSERPSWSSPGLTSYLQASPSLVQPRSFEQPASPQT